MLAGSSRFVGWAALEAYGTSGGILILWKEDSVLFCGKRTQSRWMTQFKGSSLFLFTVNLMLVSMDG